MTDAVDRFHRNLFDPKQFQSLTLQANVLTTISTCSWVASLYIPGKTGELSIPKSACLVLSVVTIGVTLTVAFKRQSLLKKKKLMNFVEEADLKQKSSVLTGLNAEETAMHLEECLNRSK
jgi:hypothetical protein